MDRVICWWDEAELFRRVDEIQTTEGVDRLASMAEVGAAVELDLAMQARQMQLEIIEQGGNTQMERIFELQDLVETLKAENADLRAGHRLLLDAFHQERQERDAALRRLEEVRGVCIELAHVLGMVDKDSDGEDSA
jgi:hypothetical protein